MTRFFIGILFFLSLKAPAALPAPSALQTLHKKVFKETECVSNGEAAMMLTGAAAGGITGACVGGVGAGYALFTASDWLFSFGEPSSMTQGESVIALTFLAVPWLFALVGGTAAGTSAGFAAGAATGALAGSACYKAFVKPFVRDKDGPRLPEG